MAERRVTRRASGDDKAAGQREPSGQDEEISEQDDHRSTRTARRGGRPDDGDASSAGGDRSGLSAREAARAALRQIAEFTAKRIEGVTGVQRGEDGWLVDIEVIEESRIPSSTDILATYQTTVDADGELMSYRRVRRYTRGRGDDGEES